MCTLNAPSEMVGWGSLQTKTSILHGEMEILLFIFSLPQEEGPFNEILWRLNIRRQS